MRILPDRIRMQIRMHINSKACSKHFSDEISLVHIVCLRWIGSGFRSESTSTVQNISSRLERKKLQDNKFFETILKVRFS
jgi:hypothetical protein